jgi:hypothetical protein
MQSAGARAANGNAADIASPPAPGQIWSTAAIT